MRRHGTWRWCWLARQVRGLRPDNNPLRRGSDRAETAIAAGLLAAFLASAPAAAVAAGHWVRAVAVAERHAQQTARHPVHAVVLQDAPPDSYLGYAEWGAPVLARWTIPDGPPRTGLVSVAAGTRAGAAITVWTDASGKQTEPPMPPVQAEDRGNLAAVAAPLALAALLLAAWKLARPALERQRLAAWDAEWRTTGPQWTNPR